MFVKTFLNNYVSWLKFEIPHCIPLKFCNVFFKDLICIFPYVACSTSPFYKKTCGEKWHSHLRRSHFRTRNHVQ